MDEQRKKMLKGDTSISLGQFNQFLIEYGSNVSGISFTYREKGGEFHSFIIPSEDFSSLYNLVNGLAQLHPELLG